MCVYMVVQSIYKRKREKGRGEKGGKVYTGRHKKKKVCSENLREYRENNRKGRRRVYM